MSWSAESRTNSWLRHIAVVRLRRFLSPSVRPQDASRRTATARCFIEVPPNEGVEGQREHCPELGSIGLGWQRAHGRFVPPGSCEVTVVVPRRARLDEER